MSKELIVDLTTPDGIRAGLIEIRKVRRHLAELKSEIEAGDERLENLENDCISAFIAGAGSCYKPKIYLPDNLFR